MSEVPEDYFNSLLFTERQKLSPTLNDTRLRTIKVCREIEVRRHKAALREMDRWIANLTKGHKP